MINGLYLVQYFHPGSTPLKSITQLPKNEAFALAKKLYSNSQCYAHRRFGPDFPEYYKHRLLTEKWLYDKFMSIGGYPEIKHPYYFALQFSDVFFRNFDHGDHIKIKLENISQSDISFTFGDSMAVMYSEKRKDPFTLEMLYQYISWHNNDVHGFLKSLDEQYQGIIEVQLWTGKYFKHEL